MKSPKHLFQVLPVELQDPAFLDRIHAYLPGWEMPKIRPENYSIGYGMLTDYMAEIFAELRRRNFQTHVNAWVDMGSYGHRMCTPRCTPQESAPLPLFKASDLAGS